MNDLIVSLIVIPLFGAGLCSVGKIFSNLLICKISVITSVTFSLITLVLLYPVLIERTELLFIVGGWPRVAGISFGMDMITWISSALILLICLCAILFAFAENSYSPMFYFTFCILVAGMQGVIITRDFFNLFVFFEILAVASYILIAYFQKSHSVLAAFRYLIIGSAAMIFYLIGVFIIYQHTGSLSFEAIVRLYETSGLTPHFGIAITALVVGIGVRTAFVPFHIWLPEAHAYAPHPISAILSGVMIKVAFVSLWRILNPVGSVEILSVLLWFGVISAFLAALWALCETDVKKILAFSSVSQMGYIVATLGMGSAVSGIAGFYHIVNHGIFKCLLFLSIGAVVVNTGERNIGKLHGAAYSFPLTAIFFFIGAMAIGGLPPFSGFISKKLIIDAAAATPVPRTILWISGIVTLTTYLKLSGIFRGRRTGSIYKKSLHPFSAVPMVILSTLCIVTGIAPSFWMSFFSMSYSESTHPIRVPEFYSISSIIEVCIIVIAAIIVYKLSNTPTGNRAASFIRMVKPGLNGALCFLMAGFVLISVLMWKGQ